MFTVTTTQKHRTVTVPQTSTRQQTQQQIQHKQQLSTDTVEFQQQTNEQVAQQTQQILEQAKATHSPELQLLGINKALKRMQAQVAKETDQSLKLKQQQSLEQMLKENAEIRKELDEPTPVNKPEYPRPVTQLEEKMVDRLFQDLAHPDPDLAKKAHERLKSLGVPEENLLEITKELKAKRHQARPKSIHFGGKEGTETNCYPVPEDKISSLIHDGKMKIFFGNSSDQVIQTGVEHELETVQHAVEPVLFGASRGIIDPDGHVKYINITENLPTGCQELRG